MKKSIKKTKNSKQIGKSLLRDRPNLLQTSIDQQLQNGFHVSLTQAESNLNSPQRRQNYELKGTHTKTLKADVERKWQESRNKRFEFTRFLFENFRI